MVHALMASHNQELYDVDLAAAADIAHLVGSHTMPVLTSSDGRIDFWFLHDSRLQVNRHATEILLGNTGFTAHDVPLLRGTVIIAGHDSNGNLDSLTDLHMRRITHNKTSWRANHILGRRARRDRASRPKHPWAGRAARRPLLVRIRWR